MRCALDPATRAVIEEALKQGIPHNVIDSGEKSPVYKLAMDWKLALPLHRVSHPADGLLVSPAAVAVIQSVADAGGLPNNGSILPAVESLRIPVQYLANLLSAGDRPVLRALNDDGDAPLQTLTKPSKGDRHPAIEEVGLKAWSRSSEDVPLPAIANYEDRFVIPTSHREMAEDAFPERNGRAIYLRRWLPRVG